MASLWMLAAGLSFSLMAVFVKLCAGRYSVAEMLFYRCLAALVLLGAFAAWRRYSVFTPHWRAHSRRAACGTLSMGIWYYTLGILPIATSVTLNYAAPIFIGLLSALAAFRAGQGRTANPVLYASLASGFIGVLILLNPTPASDQFWPGMLGLAGALIASFAFRDVKRLVSLGEPEWRLVFYYSLYTALFALAAMPFAGIHAHTREGIGLLLAIAFFGTLGQLALSRAYGHGNVLLTASFHYSGVIFSALFGLAFWGERIGARGWAGIFIVIASGVVSSVLVKRGLPAQHQAAAGEVRMSKKTSEVSKETLI